MCFLEREVYAFLVSGFAAQCRGPAFFCLWGGRRRRRGRQAMDRPQMGRWRHVRKRARGQSDTGGTTHEKCEKRKESCFLFLEERPEGVCLSSGWKQGQGRATIAALWYRHRRENVADCGTGRARDPACRGLTPWPVNPAYPAYRP